MAVAAILFAFVLVAGLLAGWCRSPSRPVPVAPVRPRKSNRSSSLFSRGLVPGVLIWSIAIASILAGPAFSQTPTEAARADAKEFGRTLIPDAQRAGRTPPNADTMPNYVANPSETRFLDDEATLLPAATAAAPSHQGYGAMRESMTTRPTIAPVDIEETIARSNIIQADANAYVSGMSIDGSQSSCVELPPSVGSPGFYEQACNRGFTRGSTTENCRVDVRHEVRSVVKHRYECSLDDFAFMNRTDRCSLYETHSCETTGTRPGACLQWFGREPNRYCVEPGEPIQQMLCDAPVPGGTPLGTQTVSQVTRSIDESACSALDTNVDCARAGDVCTDAAPPTRTVAGVPVTEPCWAWSRSYTCSTTSPQQDCDQLDELGCTFLREECITEERPCYTFDRVYRCPIPPTEVGGPQYICDGDIYCINGECETIERVPNNEFGQAAVALNAASEAGKQFDPDTLTLFRGTRHTCSKAVFGLSNCCVPRGFPLIGSCNGDDRILKEKREKGLCARVGSFCSSKVLGACLERKEAHCCYESKLSRILQEQGRPQIGWEWDEPRDEKCAGFTIDQFARLDLSRMDFSEVISEFVEAANLPGELDTATELQRKINEYYAARGI